MENPTLINYYKGAIHVFNDKSNPDRFSQSANSIRELIEKLFRDGKYEKQTSNSDRENNAFKIKIQKYVDPLGNIPKKYVSIYSSFHDSTYQYFLKVTHHGIIPDEKEYLEKLEIFEEQLMDLLLDYSECMEYTDKMIRKDNPELIDIEELIRKLKFDTLRRNFFYSISPKWIKLLKENDFFKNPPSQTESHTCPIWYESKFLVNSSKFSNIDFEILYLIIQQCTMSIDVNKRNHNVTLDFLQVAANAPVSYTNKIITLLLERGWLDLPIHQYYFDLRVYTEITEKLLKNSIYNDKWNRHILEIKDLDNKKEIEQQTNDGKTNPELKKTINNFINYPLRNINYNEFVRWIQLIYRDLNQFLKSLDFIYALFDTFKKLVNTYEIILKYQSKGSDFFIELDPIKPIPLFNLNRIRVDNELKENIEVDILLYDLLKSSIFELLQRDNPIELLQFIRNRVSNPRHSSIMYKRFLLSIYSFTPSYFQDEIKNCIIEYLGNEDIYHEYSIIVRKTLPTFDIEYRTKYIEQVSNKVKTLDLDLENDLSDVHTFLRFYEPIENFLPTGVKATYDNLISRYSAYRPEGYMGKVSIWHDQTIIEDISYSDLKQILKQEKYEINQYYLIEYNLEKHALEFVKNVNDIDTINGLFYSTILKSILETNNNGKIPTEEILPLVDHIVTIDKNRNNELLHQILHFVHKYMNDNISFEMNNYAIYSIIKYLLKISSHIEIDINQPIGKKLFESVLDSHQFHAQAALIKYNFWRNKNTSAVGILDELSDLREIKQHGINSVFILAAYAGYFTTISSLDESFVSKNMDVILPTLDHGSKLLFYVAWVFFLNENSVKIIIENNFQKLLCFFKNLKCLRSEKSDPINLLTINAILYPFLNDKDENDSLLDAFIDSSSIETRTNFLIELVKFVKNNKQKSLSESFINRFKKVLSKNKFKTNPKLIDVFLNSPFEKNYSLELIYQYLTRPEFDVKSDYFNLSNVVLELSKFPDVNEEKVLSLINLILKKSTEVGSYLNYEMVYESLNRIKESIDNKEQFNKIIEYILKTSFETKFNQLKINTKLIK
ncbi:hypothetical protein [Candidatus Nitrosocosmicus sp. SS]|jgi:hypothetical protein|uniref:hypothetical protein n=1 Tax=Candidatus Nitrosocosmicus agrestis TaxID=2563600 RepID=UPI0018A7FCE5|nr:hypothetical protein [Candidatus Nitrosocosmicus sp. SS]